MRVRDGRRARQAVRLRGGLGQMVSAKSGVGVPFRYGLGMGRARGGTDTVAGTARLRSPARRLTALGRDLWTDKAETLLLTLLTGRRSRLAFCRGTDNILVVMG